MMLRLARPEALALLGIVALLFIRRASAPGLYFSSTQGTPILPTTLRIRFRFIQDLLRLLACLVLVIALAAPQWGVAAGNREVQGIDIVIALDISSSMSTIDFGELNRLEAAKQVIAQFIARRTNDQIGLVVFAEQAFHVVPPTLDHDVLLTSLAAIDVSERMGVEDGTAIGIGLASAGNMLRTTRGASRVVILLTDGINTAGTVSPLTATRALAALGLIVYTVGVGNSDATQPDNNTSFNEEILRTIAQLADGLYFRAADREALEAAYLEIDQLTRSPLLIESEMIWQDTVTVWVGLAVVLFAVESILRITLFRNVL